MRAISKKKVTTSFPSGHYEYWLYRLPDPPLLQKGCILNSIHSGSEAQIGNESFIELPAPGITKIVLVAKHNRCLDQFSVIIPTHKVTKRAPQLTLA